MKKLKLLLYILIITNFILMGYLIEDYTGRAVYEVEEANITGIIDGDTIDTDLGRVRLLGINTPEKNREGYEQAKTFLEQFKGKKVELLKTITNKGRYGRLLRYVFYQDKNINQEILEKGLGHAYIYDEDSFTPDLIQAEQESYEKELGIWERSEDKCSECIKLTELNYTAEYVILENTCDFPCSLIDWTIKDESTRIKKLDFSIDAEQDHTLHYNQTWNNDGDTLFLRDGEGLLVLRYKY